MLFRSVDIDVVKLGSAGSCVLNKNVLYNNVNLCTTYQVHNSLSKECHTRGKLKCKIRIILAMALPLTQ